MAHQHYVAFTIAGGARRWRWPGLFLLAVAACCGFTPIADAAGPKPAPPGVVVKPAAPRTDRNAPKSKDQPAKDGAAKDGAPKDEAAPQPQGPGCPVNDRKLELYV